MKHIKHINIFASLLLFILFMTISCSNLVDSLSQVKIKYNSKIEATPIPLNKGVKSNYSMESSDIPDLKAVGYQFDGWYIGDTHITAGYNVTRDINLEAKWNPNKYTIKFDANGGIGKLSDVECTYGEKGKLPANEFSTSEQTTFLGWNTKKDGTGTPIADKGEYYNLTSENNVIVTLYAQWNQNKNKVSAVTICVNNEPNTSSTSSFDTGDTITLNTITPDATIYYTLENKEFPEGWKKYNPIDKIVANSTEDFIIKFFATKDGMLKTDITTVSYKVKKYSVSFILDEKYGKAPANLTNLVKGHVLTKEELKVIPVPNSGFVFSAWKEGNVVIKEGHKITKSLSLTAEWKKPRKTNVDGLIILPSKTDGTAGVDATYVEFGLWPQTRVDPIKAGIDTSKTVKFQGWDSYIDDNGNHYIKHKVTKLFYHDGDKTYPWGVHHNNPSVPDSMYKFSDGTTIQEGNEYYFRLDPIKWRVLTENYIEPNGKSTNRKLLLSEIGLQPFDYEVRENKTYINGSSVTANNYEYSLIRAFLNGLVHYGKGASVEKTYENNGFINKAFTEKEQLQIATTEVDNSFASTDDSGSGSYEECKNTNDKVFLLSGVELVNPVLGFSSKFGDSDIVRQINVTDYEMALGGENWNGKVSYWSRSARATDGGTRALLCSYLGKRNLEVVVDYSPESCVVPAITIDFKEIK